MSLSLVALAASITVPVFALPFPIFPWNYQEDVVINGGTYTQVGGNIHRFDIHGGLPTPGSRNRRMRDVLQAANAFQEGTRNAQQPNRERPPRQRNPPPQQRNPPQQYNPPSRIPIPSRSIGNNQPSRNPFLTLTEENWPSLPTSNKNSVTPQAHLAQVSSPSGGPSKNPALQAEQVGAGSSKNPYHLQDGKGQSRNPYLQYEQAEPGHGQPSTSRLDSHTLEGPAHTASPGLINFNAPTVQPNSPAVKTDKPDLVGAQHRSMTEAQVRNIGVEEQELKDQRLNDWVKSQRINVQDKIHSGQAPRGNRHSSARVHKELQDSLGRVPAMRRENRVRPNKSNQGRMGGRAQTDQRGAPIHSPTYAPGESQSSKPPGERLSIPITILKRKPAEQADSPARDTHQQEGTSHADSHTSPTNNNLNPTSPSDLDAKRRIEKMDMLLRAQQESTAEKGRGDGSFRPPTPRPSPSHLLANGSPTRLTPQSLSPPTPAGHSKPSSPGPSGEGAKGLYELHDKHGNPVTVDVNNLPDNMEELLKIEEKLHAEFKARGIQPP